MKHSITRRTGAMALGIPGALLMATPVLAGDLAVTHLKLAARAALQGNCNTVLVTVQNVHASQPTNPVKGKLITHPASTPDSKRTERGLYVPRLGPGQKSTLTVANAEIVAQGDVRVTALFFTDENNRARQNDSRFITVPVNRNCNRGGTGNTAGAGCDLALQFTAAGNTIAANSPTEFIVKARNVGSDACPNRAVRLYQYSGNSASGYGTAVGGTSGAIRQIPALGPNQEENLVWSANPGAPGTFTYATKFTGAHNDTDNGNHTPKKTVNAGN